jgi:hypothetical protein
MDRRQKKTDAKIDKSPYNRREESSMNKAFKSVERGVKPVAKDTNKTRRKETRKRLVGETEKAAKPAPSRNLKKIMKKPIKTDC